MRSSKEGPPVLGICQICQQPMSQDASGQPYCEARTLAPLLHRRLERMILAWKSGQVVGRVTQTFSQTVTLSRKILQLIRLSGIAVPEEDLPPQAPSQASPGAARAPETGPTATLAPSASSIHVPEAPREDPDEMVLDVGELRQEVARLTQELSQCREQRQKDRETLEEVLHQLELMATRVRELESELERARSKEAPVKVGEATRGGT